MAVVSLASATKAKGQTLPEPLCKPFPHFLRWTHNTLFLLVCAGLFAYLGTLIVVALYYIVFETTPTMNNWWHATVSNSDIRHSIRDVGEGLLGGLLAQQIIWNHYKKKVAKRLAAKPTFLDKAEIALHIPNVKDNRTFSLGQLLAAPFLVILYAIPGFAIGLWIISNVHPHLPVLPAHSSILTKTETGITAAWPHKLVGFFAAFVFGRRPAKGVFDDVQLLLVERRVANGLPLRWYHPPTFKARYNDVKDNDPRTFIKHSAWMKRFTIGAAPVALGLAIFGWYVLTFIA